MRERDHADQSRKVAPLRRADDALHVDTTGLDIEEVVAQLERQVRDAEARGLL